VRRGVVVRLASRGARRRVVRRGARAPGLRRTRQHQGERPLLAAGDGAAAQGGRCASGTALGDATELGEHVARGRRAFRRRLGQEPHQQRVELLGQGGVHVAEPRRLLEQDAQQDGHGLVAAEGALAGEAFEEHASQREEVRARIDLAGAAHLLRGHVARRADDRAGAGHRLGEQARHAEVEHAHARRRAGGASDQEEVGGLQVAVHDAAGMRRGQRAGDVGAQRHRLRRRQLAAGQARRQRLALEPLHGQPHAGLALAVGDVAHHRRVAELGEDGRLAREAALVDAVLAAQHLERHRLAALPVARPEDGAGAATAGEPLDLEALGDHRPRLEPHGPMVEQPARGQAARGVCF
jgi:hypothetical protein